MRSHPLSPEQLQVWYLDQLLAPQERRNFVVGWRIAGELDVRKLAAAIALVHARHESLRLRIVAGEGEPRQAFDPDAAPDVDLVDLSNLDSISAEANLETLIAESAQRPIHGSANASSRRVPSSTAPSEASGTPNAVA